MRVIKAKLKGINIHILLKTHRNHTDVSRDYNVLNNIVKNTSFREDQSLKIQLSIIRSTYEERKTLE